MWQKLCAIGIPLEDIEQPQRIPSYYRIIVNIDVQVGSTSEPDRILRCPSSRFRVVVTRTEADEFRVSVVEAACEAERLKAGIGINCDIAEGVVVHLLSDSPSHTINHQPGTAYVVGNDAIGNPPFDHVVSHVAPAGIHKTT